MTARRPHPTTTAHLDALTATGGEGFLVLSTPTEGGWRSSCFAADEVDAAAQWAADSDAAGRNVYVRVALVGHRLPVTRRGAAADTSAAVAFAVDLDVAGPGHKHGATPHPLPGDREAALTIIAELPPPSLLIDTGGGLHPWWILDEPEHDDPTALLEEWADRIVEAGAARRLHVDRPDSPRVLRVCGTRRRKPGVPVNWVKLTDVAGHPPCLDDCRPWCPTGRYGARELLEALPPRPAPPAPPSAPHRPRRPGEVGPADAVSRLPWSTILEPLGWEFNGMATMSGTSVELWRRPGATSDYSMKCVPDGPAVAWSDACGLPTGRGQRLNKWRVLVALHFGGDEVGAARTIRARSRELAR